MESRVKQRVAMALRCKPSEVPDNPQELKDALNKQREKLKKEKEAKHG